MVFYLIMNQRRGETFITRKITKGLAEIILGQRKCLYVGNLNAKRDWGYAKDYVEMQWKMLQRKYLKICNCYRQTNKCKRFYK